MNNFTLRITKIDYRLKVLTVIGTEIKILSDIYAFLVEHLLENLEKIWMKILKK